MCVVIIQSRRGTSLCTKSIKKESESEIIQHNTSAYLDDVIIIRKGKDAIRKREIIIEIKAEKEKEFKPQQKVDIKKGFNLLVKIRKQISFLIEKSFQIRFKYRFSA